jgi:hypothetical protein
VKSPRILGFEVLIQCDNYNPAASGKFKHYWQVKQALGKDGEYIDVKVQFGASPIRDRKALDRYCALLSANGLDFTVHPITRG